MADAMVLVQHWFDELWTRGDLKVLEQITTDDFVCHAAHDFSLRRTREEYAQSIAWYHQCFASPHWQVDEVIVAGDRVVLRSTGTAVYRGGWLDLPGTGQRTQECCINIFRIANDKIAELWYEVSDLAVVHQLGAVVAMPAQHTSMPASAGGSATLQADRSDDRVDSARL